MFVLVKKKHSRLFFFRLLSTLEVDSWFRSASGKSNAAGKVS